jgi:hypothetical protein
MDARAGMAKTLGWRVPYDERLILGPFSIGSFNSIRNGYSESKVYEDPFMEISAGLATPQW